ncbi:hypothetical protein Poly30_37400 [Planctomycetes bacterium Poly30]|uniref:Right handed beta helix domain-containing protein n=2 Tax=Saltatorellus ferox TaxID=2528018 RepID=A0A518EVV7_9BACT|nr:hypothetical protein Poly30_37400 [Planctomycetes bacterium Poly30]
MTPMDRSDDAFHVVTLESGDFTILDGFRIVSGNADDTAGDAVGGGLTTVAGTGGHNSIRLSNLTLEGNHADARGGAIFLSRVANSTLSRVVCRGNTCFEEVSAGVYTGQGGGMSLDQCGPSLFTFNSVFDGNRSIQGGGLHQTQPNAGPIRFQSCLWTDNIAQSGGGLFVSNPGNTELAHCTVAYNIVGTTLGSAGGAGLRVEGSVGNGPLELLSSIVYRNSGTFYSPGSTPLQNPNAVETSNNSLVDASSSCVQLALYAGASPPSWFDSATCIQVDPDFTNGPTRDFTLSATSPCLDAANDAHLAFDLADLDGNSDSSEFVPLDLGESTREIDTPGVSTGIDGGNTLGGAITDMGAFERQ